MRILNENPIKALLSNEIDILGHGCNCMNQMSIGLASEVMTTFPEAEVADFKFYKENRKSALGKMLTNFTYHPYYIPNKRKYIVANLYVRLWPGPGEEASTIVIAITKLIGHFGILKKSGSPIRYGFPVIGKEFKSTTLKDFIKVVEKVEELTKANITIFDYDY